MPPTRSNDPSKRQHGDKDLTISDTEASSSRSNNDVDTALISEVLFFSQSGGADHHGAERMIKKKASNYSNQHIAQGGGEDSQTSISGTASQPGAHRGNMPQIRSNNLETDAIRTASNHCDLEICDEHDLVAVAVEADDNSHLPTAVMYDPDSKPPRQQKKRLIFVYVLIILAISIVLGAVLGTSLPSKKNVGTNNADDSTMRSFLESAGIGEKELNNHSSPYAKALDWIMYQDPKHTTPDLPNFLRRFHLAAFYFATTVNHAWNFCNPPNLTANERDYCFYSNSYKGVSDDTQLSSLRWLSNTSECSWKGVVCDERDQVSRLQLGKSVSPQ